MTDHTIVLEGEVGSFAYGLNVSTSDHDYHRIIVEPLDTLIGVEPALGTHRVTPRGDGEKSQQGDTEVTVYPLRNYVTMAAKGNPNVLPVLWTTNVVVDDAYGIRGIREQFIHKPMVNAHLRFTESMARSLRGETKPKVNRPELISKYGYDTKLAAHALRVLIQSTELAEHRTMTMPMTESHREHVLSVRNGGVSLDDVLTEITDRSAYLESLIDSLPDAADSRVLNEWLRGVYLSQASA